MDRAFLEAADPPEEEKTLHGQPLSDRPLSPQLFDALFPSNQNKEGGIQ